MNSEDREKWINLAGVILAVAIVAFILLFIIKLTWVVVTF